MSGPGGGGHSANLFSLECELPDWLVDAIKECKGEAEFAKRFVTFLQQSRALEAAYEAAVANAERDYSTKLKQAETELLDYIASTLDKGCRSKE